MGYNKVIIYGNLIESYEYKRSLSPYIGQRRRDRERDNAKRSVLHGVVTGGSDTQRSEQGNEDEAEKIKRRDNARRASLAFRRIVASNLGSSTPPILLTLTYAENLTDLRQGYCDFTSFIRSLRGTFGSQFKYVSVPEFQERGAVHFHCLIWGLPSFLVAREYEERTLAKHWNRGRHKGFLYVKPTDGDLKLSSYLSKYMAKTFVDPRLYGQKAYVTSRNIQRPEVHSNLPFVWPVLEINGVVDNSSLQRQKEFDTIYLGRCKFRSFLLAN